MNESRTRLAKLAPLLATMQAGQTAEMAQRLVAATAAITPFDEAVATPEQKEALAKARPAVKTLAWALMQERVNILAQGETPQAAEAVAGVYQLVKDMPAAELTAPQRGLLAKGAAAAVAVAASNDRLNALVAAADKWRRRSGPVDRSALLPPGRRSRRSIKSDFRTATRRPGTRYRARKRSSVDPNLA